MIYNWFCVHLLWWRNRIYQSKTQTVTTISSTEVEFLAAVSCTKIALYVRSILEELGFRCTDPIPIYEDNASTIMIVNSQAPTEQARHICVQFFLFKIGRNVVTLN